ncbi:MAG: hypothetical protein FWB93_04215 [Oscillospiraceae bacterium]|nr:hypothetical protein [Oscillospiraceae bacterium]
MQKNIDVKKHVLVPATVDVGTEQSNGLRLKFNFNKQWKDLFRRISFFVQNGEPIHILLDSTDCVTVPPEIMRQAGVYEYVLSGIKEDQVLITIPGFAKVLPTGNVISPFFTPTPNEMQQVLDRMNQAVASAKAAEESARIAEQAAQDVARNTCSGVGAEVARMHQEFTTALEEMRSIHAAVQLDRAFITTAHQQVMAVHWEIMQML